MTNKHCAVDKCFADPTERVFLGLRVKPGSILQDKQAVLWVEVWVCSEHTFLGGEFTEYLVRTEE